MQNIMMVKYTTEQIDRVLSVLHSVAIDTKSHECSLPMIATVLDIYNFLRDNAVIYNEIVEETEGNASDTEQEKECEEEMEYEEAFDDCETGEEEACEIIINGGGADA